MRNPSYDNVKVISICSASCAAQLANKHVVLATLIPTIGGESWSTAAPGYRRVTYRC